MRQACRRHLAERRKALGLTQEALAYRQGVDRSTVVRWESGRHEPQPPLRRLAQVLDVDLERLSELLTGEPAADNDGADATRRRFR